MCLHSVECSLCVYTVLTVIFYFHDMQSMSSIETLGPAAHLDAVMSHLLRTSVWTSAAVCCSTYSNVYEITNLPSSVRVASQETVPALFVATQLYPPSSSG